MNKNPLLSFEVHGRITLGRIEVASVLDAANVSHFGKQLCEHVEGHPGINLLLNFSGVEYLSSAVLSELLEAQKQTKAGGGDVRLCSLKPEIRKVFEITNLDKMIVIYESDAAESIKRFDRSLDIAEEDEAWGRIT